MTEMQSLRKRSAKDRRKAIFAGFLYLIGIVGLAVAAFLPLTVGVEVGAYGALGIANFWQPIADVCGNFNDFIAVPANYILPLVASLLYTLMLLFTVINALRSISKWDLLRMKGSRRIGFNQNKLAVDAMGKMFACSFSLVVVNTILTMAIFPTEGVTFSLIGIIVVGVGLLIHFVATPVAASISKYTIRGTIVEMPRKYGMFSVILRNFFQFVAIFWIAYFLRYHQRGIAAFILTLFANPVAGWNALAEVFAADFLDGLFLVLYMVFWLIGLICFLVMLRHAINPTEYYACGNKARGRKVVRFHSFNLFLMLFLTVLAPIVADWIVSGSPENIGKFLQENLSVIYAMAVALGLFIIECIMRNYPKVKKAYREQVEESVEKYEVGGVEYPYVDDFFEDDFVQEDLKEEENDFLLLEKPAEREKPQVKKELPAPAPAAPLPPSPRAKQARAAKKKWINKGLEARKKAKASKQAENK